MQCVTLQHTHMIWYFCTHVWFGHLECLCQCPMQWVIIAGNDPVGFSTKHKLHQPGIEPRANAWKAFMLPLHHWCLIQSCQIRARFGTHTTHKHNQQTTHNYHHHHHHILTQTHKHTYSEHHFNTYHRIFKV